MNSLYNANNILVIFATLSLGIKVFIPLMLDFTDFIFLLFLGEQNGARHKVG